MGNFENGDIVNLTDEVGNASYEVISHFIHRGYDYHVLEPKLHGPFKVKRACYMAKAVTDKNQLFYINEPITVDHDDLYFKGVVVSAFRKRKGNYWRYVCEDKDGLVMIFNAAEMRSNAKT